ncbi:hypothetical protein BGZ99_000409 [Dissophora globulifera]|uniref:Splicing factor cactin central domain-containing protein n=1 Tax=Dissophora globulifera TaxID=979702 RepID=A0A9P6R0V7_9FUNG|nr:hypothetical protein BGZ99_000409 [Dissophora globulifera]
MNDNRKGSDRNKDKDKDRDIDGYRHRDRDIQEGSRRVEQQKVRETSEEWAARKEQLKKEKEEQKKALDIATSNYSMADNSFDDANLAQKFTWAKKWEVEKKKAEREREREEKDEELIRIQRASEQAQLGDWQAQEEEFCLKQAKRRAEIRIKSNRAKPIDILAMNIKPIAAVNEDDDEDEDDIGLEIDVEEPYAIFDIEKVEELFHDIKLYLSLDKHEQSIDFWRAMLIVCENKLTELDHARAGQIQRKLAAGGAIDVDYWEAILKTLIVWKAKSKLNAIHQVILQKHLEQLKTRQLREAEKKKAELAAVLAIQTLDVEGDVSGLRPLVGEDTEHAQNDEDQEMHPEPFDTLSREDQNLAVVDQLDDWAEIKRRQVLSKQFNPKKKSAYQGVGRQHPDDEFVSKILFDKEVAKQLT